MRIHSVKRYPTPSYPTQHVLKEHPELLAMIPDRWRQNKLVLGMLSMVIPLILSRSAAAGDASKSDKEPMTRVAPIFVHGEGRGSFGCVVVNPPVFLSEDEARQVVIDEAGKAGIKFTPDGLTLKDVPLPVTDQFGFLDERETSSGKRKPPKPAKKKTGDLVLDGYDLKHKVAYEVVSQADFSAWEDKAAGRVCTVSSYDFKTTASTLTNGLAKTKGDTIVAVFYEPGASVARTAPTKRPKTDAEWKASWTEREKQGKALGEEELRAQVRDFLAWLKAQGII